MGRLLRKKSGTKKKKCQNNAEPASLSKESGNAGLQDASDMASGPRVGKKKETIPAKKFVSTAKSVSKPRQAGWVDKSLQFLREVKIELKKVTWPSRKQTIGSTIVVIVLVMIVSMFLGGVDIGLSSLVRIVLH
jgi:preprotein translocase subunit SecE